MGTKLCRLCCICKLLLIVGGLNWGLVGLMNYNLVESLLGAWPGVVKIVYILVGLAAVMGIVCCAKGGCKCSGGSCAPGGGGGAPGGGAPAM